ncbi:ead/Ea22-like family protein [Enterobacter hormaechei]|uniref:ead/Ea22-like family protein n=1 Tax=Enterobacter hormaechei TaxID=158836 RepID=UPI002DBF88AE|nr:ead/Ea22-like family protein [Enterobacter hormaechei]MEB7343763.1 ead/Ea22-like family protein [Enterobacter hormaechei]
MSNIDKLTEKLKSAALKLNCEQWQTRNGFSGVEVIVKGSVAKGHGCVSYQPVASELVDTKTAKAIALFCPANILALLDELEAKDKRIAELSRHLQCAHAFVEHTEAFGHAASNGILCCGDAQWNIDESKSALAAAGKGE